MYYTEIITSETELNHIHGEVEKYFPEQKKHYAVNGRVISVRSEKPVASSKYKSTLVDISSYTKGDLHGFSIALNPVFKDRSGKVAPVMGEKEQEYINKRFAEAGINVLKADVIPCGVKWVNKRGTKFPIHTCEVKGILEIVDVEKFRNVIASGVSSRCKAYGYGMLHLVA